MAQRPANIDNFGLPPVPNWLRNAMIALVALYVVEVLAANVFGNAIYQTLAWWDPVRAPWQILTRYLVQGLGSPAVMRLFFDLLLLYFLAPTVYYALDARQRARALAAAVVGGTVVAGLLGAVGFAGAPAMGWHGLTIALLTLFGLQQPDGVIRFNFLFPITGRFIVWATGVVNLLILLGDHAMTSAEDFGVWLGILAWWWGLGPGARRRNLEARGRKVERELRGFQVLPGGRNDDTYH